MGHVQKVNLRGNRLTSASLLKLLKTLSENPGMRDIDISENKLGHSGAVAVAELLKRNHSIQTLRIGGTGIQCRNFKVIAEALKGHTSLKTFDVSHNSCQESWRYLSECLLTRTLPLTNLDVSWNYIRGGKG